MPKVDILKTDGTKAGDIELSEELFGAEVNENVLHQVVVAQLANLRQGTQSALTRAEVRGGGIKPWKQKGTGRARQGSTRSPQWTKGGIVFAPKPRGYEMKVNKKVKRLALRSSLSQKVNEQSLIVLEDLKLDAAKTKELVKVLSNLKVDAKAIIVTCGVDETVARAARNLQGVMTTATDSLSVYDILNHDKMIITVDAVKKVEEVFA